MGSFSCFLNCWQKGLILNFHWYQIVSRRLLLYQGAERFERSKYALERIGGSIVGSLGRLIANLNASKNGCLDVSKVYIIWKNTSIVII